ncbi:MAG: hypothetical protein EOO75_15495 [Myxococcales bacterium]|nr:MAG: hypothetical protein EOO75_15495 [Myxococcales bacterium]
MQVEHEPCRSVNSSARMDCSFRTERVCQNDRVVRGGNWKETNLRALEFTERHGSCSTCKGWDTNGLRCARSP